LNVLYHPAVYSDDIPRIGHDAADRIKKAIKNRLMVDPEQFGEPLRRGLHGYRKLRAGDYRIIYRVDGDDLKIFVIGNRKDVYDRADKRIG
jgi:mRNA interferase RelE/StbE